MNTHGITFEQDIERLESVNADLLAALQATLDLLTDGDAEPADADRVTAIVRNAIARATGAV